MGIGNGGADYTEAAFLLTPLGDCPADIVGGDDLVDVLDLLELLGRWGDCPVGAICYSDLNGDCVVDVQDLLILLGAWGPCGGPPLPIPRTVQDCLDRFGYDPIALQACLDAISAGQ